MSVSGSNRSYTNRNHSPVETFTDATTIALSERHDVDPS